MSRIEIDQDRCKGCGLCVHVCPRKIIVLQQDKLNARGFHPAGVTDMSRCIGCAFCATICPDSCIEVWREGGKA
ncbi:MAG: 4Fe-4S dicluster domain-containing protein [Clostridiaceae bacterium]|jgi:2-oxoglutarate ferredoxin oxidoreductase subunit delta|nr:4Fe-4S dicluster domain-containing protein [Clostridiales bacterium]MDD2441712.1 4Fe-4S dicluster domain-containing protein [Eubacteriales bacterium]NLB43837.1 4Fe-4S dicluster domain-containing protein [Clostridiaceae bacterium]